MLLNLFCLLVLDVMEPFVIGYDVMNLYFVIHLSGLTFSITPDEALVGTRRKLVIKRKIWFYLEKIKTFGLHK